MLKRSLALAAGIALSLSAALAHAEALKELKVSAIPDEAPTELLRKFKPLGAYLEKQLGMPVKFVPVADYAGVVEALAADRLDMAWLGGFTFVQARLKTGNAIPLVQREQDQQFTSKFITADPQVKSLQDLKGKTFAFGSVSSTSGSLMPRYFMQKDGIVPEQFFSRVAYSGAHDATVAWVQAGKVDAGVLNASVWQKLVDSGKVDTAKVKVFATTPTYYDYNWTVRGNLDPALAEKIKQAFLALDPAKPADKEILDLQAAARQRRERQGAGRQQCGGKRQEPGQGHAGGGDGEGFQGRAAEQGEKLGIVRRRPEAGEKTAHGACVVAAEQAGDIQFAEAQPRPEQQQRGQGQQQARQGGGIARWRSGVQHRGMCTTAGSLAGLARSACSCSLA